MSRRVWVAIVAVIVVVAAGIILALPTSPSPVVLGDVSVPNGGIGSPIPGAGMNDTVLTGVGAAPFVSSIHTRWTSQQAVAYLLAQVHHPTIDAYDICEGMITRAYGFSYGWPSAMAHAQGTPQSQRHPIIGDGSNIKPGGLVFYETGLYGHVMISMGAGSFISNDVKRAGREDVVSLRDVQNAWGYWPSFWVDPVSFEGQAGGVNPDKAPVIAPTSVTVKPTVSVSVVVNPIAAHPIRVGQHRPAVVTLKASLHWPANGNGYGRPLCDRRVRPWQRAHGFTPNCVVGYGQYHLITGR